MHPGPLLPQIVCGTCSKNDDKDCAFCSPEYATDGEGGVGNCYPLKACPKGGGSIFELASGDWDEFFPEDAKSQLVCEEEEVCERPGDAADICEADEAGDIVNCHAHQG